MRLRVGLLAVAVCSIAACSVLVESSGLTGGREPIDSADAANDSQGVVDAGEVDAADPADAVDAADADSDGAPAIHPYVQAVLADGPSLYYRLEETSGSTVKDETGNHPGTYLAGGTHGVPGAFSGSLAFGQAKNGGIDPGDIFDFVGTVPFTLEAWFRPDAYDGEYRFLFHHEDLSDLRQNYGIYVQSTSGLGFERHIDDSGRAAQTSLPAVGSWHHIVGVYDAVALQLYVDGALVATAGDKRAAKDKQRPLRLGYGYTSGEGALRGTLDEVAIYEKALGADRIAAHYQAAK